MKSARFIGSVRVMPKGLVQMCTIFPNVLVDVSGDAHSLILIAHYGKLQYNNCCRHKTGIWLCRTADRVTVSETLLFGLT